MDKCPTDEFGYLIHPEDWTEEIALVLAAVEDVPLTGMANTALRPAPEI